MLSNDDILGAPVEVRTVRGLGAVVREARTRHGMTQAGLAAKMGVSRDWVVRLEKGSPRLEAQLVLDALAAVNVTVTVHGDDDPASEPDTFSELLGGLTERGDSWRNDV